MGQFVWRHNPERTVSFILTKSSTPVSHSFSDTQGLNVNKYKYVLTSLFRFSQTRMQSAGKPRVRINRPLNSRVVSCRAQVTISVTGPGRVTAGDDTYIDDRTIRQTSSECPNGLHKEQRPYRYMDWFAAAGYLITCPDTTRQPRRVTCHVSSVT